MYTYFKSKLPESFNELFKPLSEPNRTYNFRLERPRHKYLEKFPKVTLPLIWNSLSLEIKNSQSLTAFKNLFKSEKLLNYKNFTCQKDACYSCYR